MVIDDASLIIPDWPAPGHVVAFATTRHGGVSEGSYASLNLADHVQDQLSHVLQNRALLRQARQLPGEPCWLTQTHSVRAIDLDRDRARDGDAAFTAMPGTIAVVMTADCLPVLLCNDQGSEVAAAHAGWRGLLDGVLENTITPMRSHPSSLLAWLGPAIGPRQFEVGQEVLDAFAARTPGSEAFFQPERPGHYLADLYAIARLRLNNAGVTHIYGGDRCTFEEVQHFFSYRRDHHCGRQASLIYIKQKPESRY
jgi:YfiH family protein